MYLYSMFPCVYFVKAQTTLFNSHVEVKKFKEHFNEMNIFFLEISFGSFVMSTAKSNTKGHIKDLKKKHGLKNNCISSRQKSSW